MKCLAALLVLIASASAVMANDEAAVHMSDPRVFGYFLGDPISRTAEIKAEPGEDFVAASLPQPGQLAYWLELTGAAAGEHRRGGQRYLTLRLDYQSFYVPLDTRRLRIPPSNIELTSGPGKNRVVTIPAFEFLMSPIRETFPEKSGETTATFLKADATAERLSTAQARTTALGAAIASALALALLAFHRAWWPFHRRPARPFTEAARTVADQRQSYAVALLALHRAFDRAQGERLLASDVDRFFARRPEQESAREAVQRFFSASQTFFFGGDAVTAEAALPRSVLQRLAFDLAANERA